MSTPCVSRHHLHLLHISPRQSAFKLHQTSTTAKMGPEGLSIFIPHMLIRPCQSGYSTIMPTVSTSQSPRMTDRLHECLMMLRYRQIAAEKRRPGYATQTSGRRYRSHHMSSFSPPCNSPLTQPPPSVPQSRPPPTTALETGPPAALLVRPILRRTVTLIL